MSTLSTHILDISTGKPAEGVTVHLQQDGKTLATAGIVSEDALYMWHIGSYGAVPVVTSDPATGTTVLAIHVVPAEWEWTPWGSTDTARGASRARTMAKRCAAADPHWEWPA